MPALGNLRYITYPLFRRQKLAKLDADEQARVLKKRIDDDQAKIIEAEAKQKSARDLFEGESS